MVTAYSRRHTQRAIDLMRPPDQQPLRLQIVTFPQLTDEPPCTGGYTCTCSVCTPARALAVKRGVRRDRSNPLRAAQRAA